MWKYRGKLNCKKMDTNDLKKLIGQDCLVIDPRSKKNQFEPAKILRAIFSINSIKNRSSNALEIYEHISYEVQLYKVTKSKRNRYAETYEYNRCFRVSGDRIKII